MVYYNHKRKRKGDKKMKYTIQTNYTYKKEYYSCNSLWAANLIAANYRKGDRVESVYVIDNDTCEIMTILEN